MHSLLDVLSDDDLLSVLHMLQGGARLTGMWYTALYNHETLLPFVLTCSRVREVRTRYSSVPLL